MLNIINLSKDYYVNKKPVRVLNDISLNFRKHEFVSLLGESGSGKTTLLNLIGGLDLSNEGEIIIDGKTTKNYKSKDWDAYRNHKIGFIFQDYNLINHLNIVDNVELALTLSGISQENKRFKAINLLTRLGLKDHLTKRPEQLSGGQKQRVAIARALINDPDIILADEPTGSLDSKTGLEFMDLLKEFSKNKLIIHVTHNQTLAKNYSDRIITLIDGQITSDSNPYNPVIVKNKTKNPFKSAMSYFSAFLLSLKNILTKKFRTIITAIAGSIGIVGIALTLALKNGFNIFLSDLNEENFVNMPIEIAKTQTNVDAYLSPPRYLKVLMGIAGFEPPSLVAHNKLDEFLPYVEEHIEPVSKSIVYDYDYGYSFQIVNPLNNKRENQNSSVVMASKFKDSNLLDQFNVVAESNTDVPYQAYLVVNKYNRAENKILNYLDLPLDQDIPYNDVLLLNLEVGNNNIGFVDLYITKILTPKSEVSSLKTGIYYLNDLKEYLVTKSEVKKIKKISIYASDLNNKKELSRLIDDFNETAAKEDFISYSDPLEVFAELALFITNAATYILLAFSAISLLVSSILISIITYTSVIERTNEIGILRSVGARKKDIARIFNVETVIIGTFAGIIGVTVSLFIIPVFNSIVEPIIEYTKLARLKPLHGIILVILSIILTFLAGFIPATIASKKDPVEALRRK